MDDDKDRPDERPGGAGALPQNGTCRASQSVPDRALRARQMYADGAPTRDIFAATELRYERLYYWLDGGPKDSDGSPILPPLARRNVTVRRSVKEQDPIQIMKRMLRAAESTVCEIEARLAEGGLTPETRATEMKTLAVLSRVVCELTEKLQAAMQRTAAASEKQNGNAIPRSIDELRRSLSEKLARIVAERAGEVSREP